MVPMDLIINKMREILANAARRQKIIATVSLNGLEKMHDNISGVKGAFKNATKTILSLKKMGQDNLNFKITTALTLNVCTPRVI